MPTAKFALEPGGAADLTLTWGFAWKAFTIRYRNEVIGTIAPAQLSLRNEFTLPDGSILSVRLFRGAFNQELRLERDGRPLIGAANDPLIRVRMAAGMICFIGGANMVLGAWTALAPAEWMQRVGISEYSAAAGAVFVLLGLLVYRKMRWALLLAMTLFVLDAVAGFILTLGEGTPMVGGIIARFFFLMPMIGGLKGFATLHDQSQPAPIPESQGRTPIPHSATQEAVAPGEARLLLVGPMILTAVGILAAGFIPFAIAAVLSANDAISDNTALLVAVPPMILAGIVCVAWMVRFASLRKIDLCPDCGKLCQYRRQDKGRLLRCPRCKRAWTAGTESP